MPRYTMEHTSHLDDSKTTEHLSNPDYRPLTMDHTSNPSHDSPATLPISSHFSDSRNNRCNGCSILPLPTTLPQQLRCEPDVVGEEAMDRLDRKSSIPYQPSPMLYELPRMQLDFPRGETLATLQRQAQAQQQTQTQRQSSPIQYKLPHIQYQLPPMQLELPRGKTLKKFQRQPGREYSPRETGSDKEEMDPSPPKSVQLQCQPSIPPARVHSGRVYSRLETGPGTGGVDRLSFAPVQLLHGPTNDENECNVNRPSQNCYALFVPSAEKGEREFRRERCEVLREGKEEEIQRREEGTQRKAEEGGTGSKRKRCEDLCKSMERKIQRIAKEEEGGESERARREFQRIEKEYRDAQRKFGHDYPKGKRRSNRCIQHDIQGQWKKTLETKNPEEMESLKLRLYH